MWTSLEGQGVLGADVHQSYTSDVKALFFGINPDGIPTDNPDGIIPIMGILKPPEMEILAQRLLTAHIIDSLPGYLNNIKANRNHEMTEI